LLDSLLQEMIGSMDGKGDENKESERFQCTEDEEKTCKGKINEQKNNKKPNLFVSLQVDNPKIQEAMTQFQQTCTEYDPDLSHFLVPVRKAHITLLVLHAEKERLEDAKELFNTVIKEKIVGHFDEDEFEVEFSGVGAFDGNRVIFAEPKTNTSRMTYMNHELYQAFSENSFSCESKFNPHLTLLKKGYKKKSNVQKVPPEAYENIKDTYFGIQQISGVQLLSMCKPQTKEGYYFCEAEYKFKKRTPLENAMKDLSEKKEQVRTRTRDNVISSFKSKHGNNVELMVAGIVTGAAVMWAAKKKFVK